MKFNPPIQYPDGRDLARSNTLVRWCSTGGRWRLQADANLFGVRLHLVHSFDRDEWNRGFELVYCMGPDRSALLLVPRVVLSILESVDEGATLAQVKAVFPEQTRKPMRNDPACWRELCRLAGVSILAEQDLGASGAIHFDLLSFDQQEPAVAAADTPTESQ